MPSCPACLTLRKGKGHGIGILVCALFGLAGAAVTNHLLRDEFGLVRILLATLAGMAAGALTMFPLAIALLYATRLDFSGNAIIGVLAGPPFTALAAWRWRARPLPPDDLRAR